MGVCVYSNGITEDYRPSKLTFTEEELVKMFSEYTSIKTVRVPHLVNTWAIFGKKDDDPLEFNRIASDMVQEAVYSHALFIHDSEIDPKWNATDTILYKSYDEFIIMMKKYIDSIAANILDEFSASKEYEGNVEILPQLITLGATHDKRILFEYNPAEQTNEFYSNEVFYKFSQKVYEYIKKNKQEKEPFTIYADKKTVIIIESLNVKTFLNTMIEKFKVEEDYEICTDITKIMNNWTKATKKPQKKKTGTTREKLNGK